MSALFAKTIKGSGTPIVLLHGFGGSGEAWQAVFDRLPGLPVIIYDLPGHGRSLDFPEAGPPATAAKAIIADLTERGIGKVHIAGHSMGGAIASLIALMKPDLVASLTLVAPGGYGPEINAPLLRRYASSRMAADITDCLAEMSGPNTVISPEIAAEMEATRAREGQTAMLEKIVALITRDGQQGVIPASALEKIAAPVRVLWGDRDSVLPVSQTENLPEDWELCLIEDAGHMLADECPDEVATLILDMIDMSAD